MRIFNTDKTQEITEYDREQGKLVEDTLTIHIPYSAEVPEVKHKKILHQGEHGSTFQYVIDVPYQPEVPEHDEYEEIYRYVPYTEKELAEREIWKLKEYLSDTDYCVIKCMDMGVSTAEAYPEVYQKRLNARARINELEEIINAE